MDGVIAPVETAVAELFVNMAAAVVEFEHVEPDAAAPEPVAAMVFHQPNRRLADTPAACGDDDAAEFDADIVGFL